MQTEFGFHVLRLTRDPGRARSRSLDEVRKELTAEIAKQKGAKKFAEAADGFNNLVYEQSDSLKPAAERYKLKIETTDWIARQASAEHRAARASRSCWPRCSRPTRSKQRRNTDAVEVAPGVLVAARVAEHQPETQRPFGEVQGRGRAQAAAARGRGAGEARKARASWRRSPRATSAGLQWGAAKAGVAPGAAGPVAGGAAQGHDGRRGKAAGLHGGRARRAGLRDLPHLQADSGRGQGRRAERRGPGRASTGGRAATSWRSTSPACARRPKVEVHTANLERK